MDVVKVRVDCLKSEGIHKLKQVQLNSTWNPTCTTQFNLESNKSSRGKQNQTMTQSESNKYNPIQFGIKQELKRKTTSNHDSIRIHWKNMSDPSRTLSDHVGPRRTLGDIPRSSHGPTWSDMVRHGPTWSDYGPTMVRHGFCVLAVVCQMYYCVSSV